MKTIQIGGGVILAALVSLFLGACGNTRNSASSTNGSTASTVGGTSVTGDTVRIDLTTNRTQIARGDVALVTVRITCANINGNCPVSDSNGQPVFAAHPISSNEAASSSLSIIANYSISSAASISPLTQTLTLPAGTAAVFTAGVLTTSAILGAQASEAVFPVSVTGANIGAAILTVQSLTTTASIVIDVTNSASGLFR